MDNCEDFKNALRSATTTIRKLVDALREINEQLTRKKQVILPMVRQYHRKKVKYYPQAAVKYNDLSDMQFKRNKTNIRTSPYNRLFRKVRFGKRLIPRVKE